MSAQRYFRGLLAASLAALAACASTTEVQPPPETTPPPENTPPQEPLSEQHAWLHQLVGEWDVVYEFQSPGAEGFSFEATERARSLGGRWIVSEGAAGDFRSILTLGHDPQQESFVGTWIDTNQTRMWVFQGELDESGNALHLHAEGPSMLDPSRTARYREAIELLGPDRKRVTSSTLQEDGTWSTFLTADGRRRDRAP